ncbi:MAG: cysteine--tRNA ligase [Proteobacteria bacterium]|nr:cysteine--tRNA ligase [Pseudomonadota bacterium]
MTPINFKLYNTQTRTIDNFKPLEEGKVGLYVCGITPYELSHIGHARCGVVYDTFVKFLRNTGWQVKHVQNFTDVDDKIINKSKELGIEPLKLAEQNIQAYKEDMAKLNVATPDVEPKVSTHINEIIDFIKVLNEKDVTYIHENGDVMYDVTKFENYGCLSHRNLDEQISGMRIDDSGKKNSEDFVLWKMAKKTENISWDSPWGAGRPGWHIECSAMAAKHLGDTFDIHGGGLDLVFPHHENEVAQSDAYNSGCKTVNYWMHTSLIKVDSEKMSKSLGNFFLIRDILKQFDGETIRLFLLGTNYNHSLNFSHRALEQSKSALERLYRSLENSKDVTSGVAIAKIMDKFYSHLANNLNTPLALSNMFKVSKQINVGIDKNEDVADLKATMLEMSEVLGLMTYNANTYLKDTSNLEISENEIEALISARQIAKDTKDWAKADEIRDKLLEKGIILKDSSEGTTWQKR